jgi:acyl-CoA synthetase (AMP-forming)/AMP-acid ligase II
MEESLTAPSTPTWENFVEVLVHRALSQPDETAFIFLKDGELEQSSLTFGELESRARGVGIGLRKLGAAGERVLLLYPHSLDFIVAFLGTLYAGAVAVPAPLQHYSRSSRVHTIIDNASPKIALSSRATLQEARQLLAGNPLAPPLFCVEEFLEAEIPETGPCLPDYAIGRDSLAFLQFTSGSTRAPRGVMITHGNLLENQRLIECLYRHSRSTIAASWLPMFHDMGLVGDVLQPIYVGYKSVLMPPVAFLQEPSRWLRAITRYKATTAGGPNFGYDFCVDRTGLEQRQSLDLSSWDIAYNGSEPVRARTLERFVNAFEPCGFRATSFYPTYGMAEATLLISGGEKNVEPVIRRFDVMPSPGSNDQPSKKLIVSCGRTGPEHKVVIVDPDTQRPLTDSQVGEIWLTGPSVSPGYWNLREQSAEIFNRRLTGAGDESFMRTGDLGFLEDGELYVTGRMKDLIIVRGRNHYPQDIEETAQTSHPALRLGFGAAFVVEDDANERLVLVNEVRRQYLRKLALSEIAGEVRAAVVREHGLRVAGVVLLKTASVPKTSSGKIQRGLCKARFLNGTLDVVGHDGYGAAFSRPIHDMQPGRRTLRLAGDYGERSDNEHADI